MGLPRPKLTDDQFKETRERILDAASQIIREQGFETLSSRILAERLEMSHMTLYTYFASMDSLIEALSSRHYCQMLEKQRDWLKRAKTDDIELLLDEILAAFRDFLLIRDHFMLIWGSWKENRDFEKIHEKGRAIQFLAEILQAGMGRGVITEREPAVAAATVMGMLLGPILTHHWQGSRDTAFTNRIVDEVILLAKQYLIIDWKTNRDGIHAIPAPKKVYEI